MSFQPNQTANSSDLMNLPKVEHNPALAINRFDGLQPPKVSFAIRRTHSPAGRPITTPLQTLTRSDVDKMIKVEMLAATERSAFGAKELTIDLAKFILSLFPGSGMVVESAKVAMEHADTAIEVGVEAGSIRSRFRRFRNRWLWFVMNARSRAGDLFKTLSDETPQR